MATVVITFFLFVLFYVCIMDADCTENQRDQLLSRREKRWSMNSQRLEEIVALLMRPISSDARRYFDTDLTALLEEYLTEAGLHALDAGDDADVVAPNYAELALLLQQSAAIYGRKVDFLYQHVVDVSEALHANALFSEPAAAESPEGGAGGAGGRAARARAPGFARAACPRGAARRERGPARPHPTLPRAFMQLEPRLLAAAHVLRDYAGDLIGLLDDFQASVDLNRSRMLVEDDYAAPTDDGQPPLRPLSLVELQQAMEAAAPPLPGSPGPPCWPLRSSTPLSPERDTSATSSSSAHDSALDCTLEPVVSLPTPTKRERKRRRSVVNIEDIIEGSVKIIFDEDLRRRLAEAEEFSIPTSWIKKTVKKRESDILSSRRSLRELEGDLRAQFPGWRAGGGLRGKAARDADSDDDGFFEQSSVGDASAADEPAWHAGVLARAAASAARGLDVRGLARRLLRALPPAPAPFPHVLRLAARDHAHVSHVLLATLFLANAGNVRIIPGAPLSVSTFSLELVSADERLYSAAADEEQFLR